MEGDMSEPEEKKASEEEAKKKDEQDEYNYGRSQRRAFPESRVN